LTDTPKSVSRGHSLRSKVAGVVIVMSLLTLGVLALADLFLIFVYLSGRI
jgi:hypothetical protein